MLYRYYNSHFALYLVTIHGLRTQEKYYVLKPCIVKMLNTNQNHYGLLRAIAVIHLN